MSDRRRTLGNVIVGTDFSADSAQALERAARLPFAPGASLTVLHVLPGELPADLREVLEAAARDRLTALAERATDIARAAGQPELAVFRAFAVGPAAARIAERAHDARAELIVIGRHGRRSFRALLLGSTAERVVRLADTPALFVSQPATDRFYRRPLVAMDRGGAALTAVELALRLVAPDVTSIPVIHAVGGIASELLPFSGARPRLAPAFPDPAAAIDAVLARLPDVSVRWDVRLREGDPRELVLDAIGEIGPDLLVLGTHGRGSVTRALLGSVAEALVRTASCDVLVARPTG